MLTVGGDENLEIYSGLQEETVYLPEGGGIQEIATGEEERVFPLSRAEQIEAGGRLYAQNCAACHQVNGQGIEGAFPPIAASDYLLEDVDRAIGVITNGLSVPIEVNGVAYNGVMPAVHLSDYDVANVMTYILNSFGNDGGDVDPSRVARVRASH
jgi:nitrite reductase (NO-forming)